MTKIILISCVSRKLDRRSKAKDLYISALFRYNLKYARLLNPDKIFILSAKYGLLDLEKEIEPYNITLNNLSSMEIKEWANKVLKELKVQADIKKDEFIFLAGNNYRKYLIPQITNYRIPMQGLGIGKQLKFLKEKTK